MIAGDTLLSRLLARPGSGLAVATPTQTWSADELIARAAGAARWLADRTTTETTHVPLLVPASADALALIVAGAAIGRPIAPLNPRSGPADLVPLLDPVRTPLVVVPEGPLTDLVQQAGCRAEALPSFAPSDEALPVPLDTDLAMVLHTSGTTGLPKPVRVRHRELLGRASMLTALTGLVPESMTATGAPLHHIAGIGHLLPGLAIGCAVAPFGGSAVEQWPHLAGVGVTHMLLVPTMIYDLLDAGTLADAPLQLLQYGASPMPVSQIERVIDVLPDVDLVGFYGQTEGSPLTVLDAAAHRARSGLDTVGVPVPGLDLKLVDEEVVVRAPHLFAALDNAWMPTGDLGRIDDEGRLTLIGRAGDRIIRGGENVDPVEVEHLLLEHPAVRDVALVGYPDDRLGQKLRAFVVGEDLPPWDELRAWTRARTMGFKVPDDWIAIDELPRNAAGKVLRRLL